MKKLLSVTVGILIMTANVFASGGVNVTVNGIPVDMEGVIVDGRTMVPVRGVFEKLGYSVEWDNGTKTATLTKGDSQIVMTNGESYFTYNGTQITPDVPQQIVEGRFMLPLRAVGESLNAKVDWDAETKTASINLGGLKIGSVLNLDEISSK